MLRHLPEHDSADLAAYGRASRRPGRLRGAIAELAGSGHRVATAPVAIPAPLTTSQVAALDLLRKSLEHRDDEIARTV